MTTSKIFKKIVDSVLIWVIIFVPMVLWQVNIPCFQCKKTVYSENIFCRMVTGFNMNYLHYHCVDDYCKDNPVEWGNPVGQDGKRLKIIITEESQ